ncbi:MFS transporter [Lacticaseibacillus suihuaensis]
MNHEKTTNLETPQEPKFYKRAPLSWVHLRIYLAIILGQFTSGYAIQISGTAISVAQRQLNLSSAWVGLIGAGTLIGLAGSLLVGKLADRVGRRRLLLANMWGLALVSLGQLVTVQLGWTLVFRVLAGLMIAVDYTAGNTLLIEWLPFKDSGRLQSHLVIYWTLGFIAASFAATFISGFGAWNWRLMMVSPVVPALITAVFRNLAKLPTSPSWLVNQGRPQAATRVIRRHLGRQWGLSRKQRSLKRTVSEPLPWTAVFHKPYRRATAVGGAFYAAQSFTFFGISLFLPLLVGELGFGAGSFAQNLYVGAMLVGVLLGTVVFNRVSRRWFLIGDFALAAAALGVLVGWRQAPPVVALAIFAGFAVVLSAGLVLDYPYTSELFDSRVRGTGVGMVVTLSRIGAAAGTFLLPVLTSAWGVNAAMLVCGGLLAAAAVFCLFAAPETAPQFAKPRKDRDRA